MSAGRHHLLDASALLALILEEPGADRVQEVLDDSEVLVVNLAEVARKLFAKGVPEDEVFEILDGLKLETGGDEFGRPWPADRRRSPSGVWQAICVGALASANRKIGLSLGDAACLMTAALHDMKVVTADREWLKCAWPDLEDMEGFEGPEVIVIR